MRGAVVVGLVASSAAWVLRTPRVAPRGVVLRQMATSVQRPVLDDPAVVAAPPLVTASSSDDDAAAADVPPKEVDWLDAWYPVCFAAEIPDDAPFKAQVFDRPLVLFRDATTRAVRCLADECPHRLAPLSDGRLVELPPTSAAASNATETGIECSYHAWAFRGECGSCARLPQLDEAGKAKHADWPQRYGARKYAVVERQGVCFVHLKSGESHDVIDVDQASVPTVDEFDRPGWIYEQDYARDLPYDYTTLLENIIDPSHVPVSHHGTSQGNRALAAPLPLRILRSNAKDSTETTTRPPPSVGDDATETTTTTSLTSATQTMDHPMSFEGEVGIKLHASSRLGFASEPLVQRATFSAPSKLTYAFHLPSAGGDAVAAFYAIPVARGRSRVLVRRGRNFATHQKLSKAALVAKHLENNVVFDQDMAFLAGQEQRLQTRRNDGHGGAWKRAYVTPTTADRFVLHLRKQLDALAPALPWRSPPRSPATSPLDSLADRRNLLDRYAQHTRGCAACLEALALTRALIADARVVSRAAAALLVVRAAIAPAASVVLDAVQAVAQVCLAAVFAARFARAFVVGPTLGSGVLKTVGALPAGLALAQLGVVGLQASVLSTAGAWAAGLVNLVGVAAAATLARRADVAARRLEQLEARFVYTEEAKALQHGP